MTPGARRRRAAAKAQARSGSRSVREQTAVIQATLTAALLKRALRSLVEQVDRVNERAEVNHYPTRLGPTGVVSLEVPTMLWEHGLLTEAGAARRLLRSLESV